MKNAWIPPAPPGTTIHESPKPKPKTRVFTWVILGINGLFLWWIIAAVNSTSHLVQNCTGLVGQALDMCNASNAGTAIGTGAGVFIILVLCAVVDIILGVLWLVTRRNAS